MARIAFIGGHGKVALHTLPLLAQAGHEVDAVIRNPAHAADVEAAGARPVVADIEHLDADQTRDLLAAHDVVVWSAGAGGGSPERTYAVDRDAAIRTMDAARDLGVRHYVMVSYFGARTDHGVDPGNSFFHYAEAKAAADSHLRGAGVPFTILMPSTLTLDAPSGQVDTKSPDGGRVARGNVAQLIAAVVAAGPERMDAVELAFNDGHTPIEQAVAEAGHQRP